MRAVVGVRHCGVPPTLGLCRVRGGVPVSSAAAACRDDRRGSQSGDSGAPKSTALATPENGEAAGLYVCVRQTCLTRETTRALDSTDFSKNFPFFRVFFYFKSSQTALPRGSFRPLFQVSRVRVFYFTVWGGVRPCRARACGQRRKSA